MKPRERLLWTLAALAVLGAAFTVVRATAAPGTVTAEAAGAAYTVTVELTASTGRVGADVAVRPETATAVTLTAVMPGMGHVTPPIAAARTAPGRFHAEGELFGMAGRWRIDVGVQGPGGEETVAVEVTVD